MPTIIDATVVNQPYDTSGNGGRKLVRLSNGWLVTGAYNSTKKQVNLYKSIDNGATWTQLCYLQDSTTYQTSRFSMVSNGTNIYVIVPRYNGAGSSQIHFYKIDATTQANVQATKTSDVDVSQNDFSGTSLAINEAGTELHAAWSSKNSTYPNSFNIRYAKGTINADGSVTWGSVEQVTVANNSSEYIQNPTIVIKDGIPFIIAEVKGVGSYFFNGNFIVVVSKTFPTTTSGPLGNAKANGWQEKTVYNGGSYSQSSPSACVSPNGRIWVAWHGAESGYNAGEIRVSYSDDGGVTWSTQQRLTTNNQETSGINPSITVNKNNEIFILYNGRYGTATYKDIYLLHYNGSSWTNTNITNTPTTGHNQNPSALVDLAIDFTQPLFIYSAVQRAKVGFYGTWVVNTISVTPGYIGQKTSADKSNILTYSITTDGEMSDIIEKINGVTIATRTNPTSGQEFTVSLTQEQWDAIKYGNGHTLTIEMGSDKWTYTFDKRLNANDDILSAVKGVHDLQDHLNAIKAQLASAIRSKGGTVNDTDAWSAFKTAIDGISAIKKASGSLMTDGSGTLTVTGLSFSPTHVSFYTNDNLRWGGASKPAKSGNALHDNNGSLVKVTASFTSNGFTINTLQANTLYNWIAYE